jgi:hypothetical protein
VQLQIVKASTEHEIDAAFATLVSLLPMRSSLATTYFFFSRREQLVALTSRYAPRDRAVA